MQPAFHACSLSTINFDNFFVPPILRLNLYIASVRNSFALPGNEVSRRLLTSPDDRMHQIIGVNGCSILSSHKVTSRGSTTQVRLLPTQSHHPSLVSSVIKLSLPYVFFLPRPLPKHGSFEINALKLFKTLHYMGQSTRKGTSNN